jgi:hypothetical protein
VIALRLLASIFPHFKERKRNKQQARDNGVGLGGARVEENYRCKDEPEPENDVDPFFPSTKKIKRKQLAHDDEKPDCEEMGRRSGSLNPISTGDAHSQSPSASVDQSSQPLGGEKDAIAIESQTSTSLNNHAGP